MHRQFNILKKSRQLTLKAINNLTIDQVNKIPKGFSNNVAWNIAHLVVTQQLLCYKFSGLDCLVTDELINNFQKGSIPSYTVSEKEFEIIKKQFIDLPIKLEEDLENGVFKNYNSYTTSVDITLKDIKDAISFNNYHEGIHLGVILQLKKFI